MHIRFRTDDRSLPLRHPLVGRLVLTAAGPDGLFLALRRLQLQLPAPGL